MSETAPSAEAFAAESGTVPGVVNSGNSFTTNSTNAAYPASNTSVTKFFTEDDLSRVRSQEKEKLYPEIERLKEQVNTLTKEREEKEAAKAQKLLEEEEAKVARDKAKQEEELSAKELINLKEQELLAQLQAERQEREKAFTLLERERQFHELETHRSRRLEEERENIMPELLDLVNGSTPDEVEQSIASLKERTSRILDSVQQASQAARRDMAGTRPTLPAAGPMDINSENRSFTAEEIAAMPMNEYAKYRSRLLSPTAQGKTQGLFGSN